MRACIQKSYISGHREDCGPAARKRKKGTVDVVGLGIMGGAFAAMATGHAMHDTASVCAVLEAMAGVKRRNKQAR